MAGCVHAVAAHMPQVLLIVQHCITRLTGTIYERLSMQNASECGACRHQTEFAGLRDGVHLYTVAAQDAMLCKCLGRQTLRTMHSVFP